MEISHKKYQNVFGPVFSQNTYLSLQPIYYCIPFLNWLKRMYKQFCPLSALAINNRFYIFNEFVMGWFWKKTVLLFTINKFNIIFQSFWKKVVIELLILQNFIYVIEFHDSWKSMVKGANCSDTEILLMMLL